MKRDWNGGGRARNTINAGITGVGDVAVRGAAALMNGLPEADWLLADRGYDADWFRETLVGRGTTPCIPGRKSRKKTVKYDKRRYKRRNRSSRDLAPQCTAGQ